MKHQLALWQLHPLSVQARRWRHQKTVVSMTYSKDLAQQYWHWEAELLLVQAVHLHSASPAQANAVFLVPAGEEGLSAQDRVYKPPFSVAWTEHYYLWNSGFSTVCDGTQNV